MLYHPYTKDFEKPILQFRILKELLLEVVVIIALVIWPASTTFTVCSAAFSLCARAPNFPFTKPSALLPALARSLFPICHVLPHIPVPSMHHTNAYAIMLYLSTYILYISTSYSYPHLDSLNSSLFTCISIPCFPLTSSSHCFLLEINNSGTEDL